MAAADSGACWATVALNGAFTYHLMKMLRALGAGRRRRIKFFAIRVTKGFADRLAIGFAVGVAVGVALVVLISGPGRRGRGAADQRAWLRATIEDIGSGPTIWLPILDSNTPLKITSQVVGVAGFLVGRAAAVNFDVVLREAITFVYVASSTAHVVPVILDDTLAGVSAAVAIALRSALTFVKVTVLLVAIAAAHDGRRMDA